LFLIIAIRDLNYFERCITIALHQLSDVTFGNFEFLARYLFDRARLVSKLTMIFLASSESVGPAFLPLPVALLVDKVCKYPITIK
jgi:hypothetical protein